MQKSARSWIDESDPAGHVRQDFLVEDDFALQPLRRLYLPSIKPATQPREHCCESDQPRRQDGHSSQKIVNWFVSEALRLLYYRYPTSWLDRTGRIEICVLLEMSRLVFAHTVAQQAA